VGLTTFRAAIRQPGGKMGSIFALDPIIPRASQLFWRLGGQSFADYFDNRKMLIIDEKSST
jgi:hypothetical protein